MDRDGFVEFVQRTFVEWKTKGSKVVTHSLSAEITAYLHWNAIAQYVHLVCINQLALHLRPVVYPWTGPVSEPGNQFLRSAIHGLSANLYFVPLDTYARSMDCARNLWIVA